LPLISGLLEVEAQLHRLLGFLELLGLYAQEGRIGLDAVRPAENPCGLLRHDPSPAHLPAPSARIGRYDLRRCCCREAALPGGFPRSWRALAVALDVGAEVVSRESGASAHPDRGQLAAPDDPVQRRLRDAEKTADRLEREQGLEFCPGQA
jgi:hypothetical protein